MPEWTQPWGWLWLWALPLVFWLHRRQPDPPDVPVSAAFLFEDVPAPHESARPAPRSDPRWRRRSLVFVALAAASAAPQLAVRARPPLTVWLDDAPSLFAEEADGPRATALAQALAQAALREAPPAIQLRSLRDPGRTLVLDGAAGEIASRTLAWLAPSPRALSAPPAVLLDPESRHWLVTDDADPAVAEWARSVPLARVLSSGAASENAAVVRLGLRRAPDAPGGREGTATVVNAGREASVRTLTLRAGGTAFLQHDLRLAPGAEQTIPFRVPDAAQGRLDARLTPGDALEADDGLALELASIAPRSLRIDGRCGPRVTAALAAHPGIALRSGPVQAGDALVIGCEDVAPATRQPSLWLRPLRDATPLGAPASWRPEAGDALRALALEDAALAAFDAPPAAHGTPLLVSGETALVLETADAPRALEVRIDLEDPRFATAAEMPALLAGLLDRVAGRALLDPIERATRPAPLARIAPGPRSLPGAAQAVAAPEAALPLAGPLLVLASLLLVVDGLRSRHEPVSLAARGAVLALLLAALLAPRLLTRAAPVDWIVLLDVSRSAERSVGDGAWSTLRTAASEASAQRADAGRLALIRFGATPALEIALAPFSSPAVRSALAERSPPRTAVVDPGASDLGAAIRAGLRIATPGHVSALLLASDGIDTQGDADAALFDAHRAGIRVIALAPAPGSADGPRLRDVRFPPRGRAGERLRVTARVDAAADGGRLVLTSDGSRLDALDLAREGPTLRDVSLALTPARPGPLDLELTLAPAGADAAAADTDRRTGGVDVAGPGGVVYVSDAGEPALLRALASGGWPVRRVSTHDLARDPALLEEAAAVVLDDVPAFSLPPELLARLASAARERGTGLLALGGPHAFASGGYRGSALEALLPLASDASHAPGSLAVVFVLDKSGSMERDARGRARLEAAARALRESAASLEPGDAVGLIAFDAEARELLPLAPTSDPGRALADALRARAEGGTRAGPALRLAADRLATSPARDRLLVLLSDGFLRPSEVDTEARRLAGADLRVVAIALGPDADTASLERLVSGAREGRVLRVADAAELPRVVRGVLAESQGTIGHGPVSPALRAPLPFLSQRTMLPAVLAWSRTRAQPDALLWVTTPDGDPLLATRSLGAARTLALPAGLGAWAPGWLAGADGARFASAVTGWVARSGENDLLHVETALRGEGLLVAVDAPEPGSAGRDGSEQSLLQRDPAGRESTTRLAWVAPGRFEACLPAPLPGRHTLVLRVGDTLVRRTVWVPADVEREQQDPGARAAGGSALSRWESEGLLTQVASDPKALAAALPDARRPVSGRALLISAAALLFLATLARELRPRGIYASKTWPSRRSRTARA